MSTNCKLRRAIDPADPAVEKFKRENRSNKEAIVEDNESDQGSKVGHAVSAADLGLTTQEWDHSLELEAFLSYPFDIKQTIENLPYCTGAQAIQLLHDLKENFCDPDAGLIILSVALHRLQADCMPPDTRGQRREGLLKNEYSLSLTFSRLGVLVEPL